MSKPLVTFPDPEIALIDYYKGTLPARLVTPPTVSASFPASTPTNGHVQVELEVGTADDYPVTERAQMRVTCWYAPGKRNEVKDLASLAQGLVYTHPGDSEVAGASVLIGRSNVITDPDTRYLMCWFLARVNLKATLLAS